MSTEADLPKDLTPEEFGRFRDYINSHSGIYLEESKRDSLRISLVTRATRQGFDSFDDYFTLLSHKEEEFKELLNLVTINETSFFRFPAQFDALRNQVLPEIMRQRTAGENTMRIWSAGCSTGEEPYSLAITLADMGIEGMGWRPQILGTDVSTAALGVARTGIYAGRALLNIPPDVILRHFKEVEGGQKVRDQTRSLVEFGYHNLIKEPYPLSLMGSWDVIFCRNVTIYFKLESTRRVVANFYRMLNPGGYLFIGHSETLTNISQDFEPVEVGGVFLYRKPLARATSISIPVVSPVRSPKKPKPAERAPRHAASRTAGPEKASAKKAAVRGAGASAGAGLEDEPPIEQARRHANAGEAARVLESLARLDEADRRSVEAHLLAAYAHADLGDYEEAFGACREALGVNPLLPAARYILGVIHQRQGDTVGAVSELKKTIYIDPEFAIAHLNLGNLYKAQRKFDAACRSYENALRALYANPDGEWAAFMGGFKADLLVKTIERSLLECRKAAGSE